MYTDVDCPGAAGSGVKVLLAVGVPDPVAKALDYLRNDCKMYIQGYSHACMHSFTCSSIRAVLFPRSAVRAV